MIEGFFTQITTAEFLCAIKNFTRFTVDDELNLGSVVANFV